MTEKKPVKQLRGKELNDRIESTIKNLAAIDHEAGREYVFNASLVAREVPTTRVSLDRRNSLIDEVLAEVDSRRRMVTGSATIEQLRDQVARFKAQVADREVQINALRTHHIEIYERFHDNSLEGALLISPIMEQASKEAGFCFFCGGEAAKLTSKNNVVPFKHRR
jgi:hypothetical protein